MNVNITDKMVADAVLDFSHRLMKIQCEVKNNVDSKKIIKDFLEHEHDLVLNKCVSNSDELLMQYILAKYIEDVMSGTAKLITI